MDFFKLISKRKYKDKGVSFAASFIHSSVNTLHSINQLMKNIHCHSINMSNFHINFHLWPHQNLTSTLYLSIHLYRCLLVNKTKVLLPNQNVRKGHSWRSQHDIFLHPYIHIMHQTIVWSKWNSIKVFNILQKQ